MIICKSFLKFIKTGEENIPTIKVTKEVYDYRFMIHPRFLLNPHIPTANNITEPDRPRSSVWLVIVNKYLHDGSMYALCRNCFPNTLKMVKTP